MPNKQDINFNYQLSIINCQLTSPVRDDISVSTDMPSLKSLKQLKAESLISSAQGNALRDDSDGRLLSPERATSRLITPFQGWLEEGHSRFTGRCPVLLITPFQGLAFAGHSFRRTLPCAVDGRPFRAVSRPRPDSVAPTDLTVSPTCQCRFAPSILWKRLCREISLLPFYGNGFAKRFRPFHFVETALQKCFEVSLKWVKQKQVILPFPFCGNGFAKMF
jgi:hypothetical protein